MSARKAPFVILYLLAVVASSCFAELKYRSLNFQTRDYAYYLQFSSKLLDSRMTKAYSLNPEGYNWLRYYGTEGAGNFHRSLHFEPIKYFYAVIYYFANTPRVLFWFAALIFFLPVLYLGLTFGVALPDRAGGSSLLNGRSKEFVLLIALLYVLLPAALLTPAFDLRPYIFLTPFFFMTLIAMKLSRPWWERLLWFNCMFLAREEALILAPTFILLAIVWDDDDALHRRTVVSFTIAWIVWGLLTLGFFKWTAYPTAPFHEHPDLFRILLLCGIGLVALALAFSKKVRRQSLWRRPLQIAAYSTVLVPLGFQIFDEDRNAFTFSAEWLAQTIFSPRYALHAVALLGLLLVWRKNVVEGSKAPRVVLVSVAVCLLALGVVSPWGSARMGAGYLRQIGPARDIFALRESTDKYETSILTDYATHQAFADYQNVYVYNRLPWDTTPGEGRYYPANSQIVQALVNERIEYVVVSKESAADVEAYHVENRQETVSLFENEKFFGVRISRK
ncbi:MAG: hypothetical protein QOD75_847 [Blastocatellia bacterium]|nr:hypothetical protein [Blastocatellia bacterium]